MKNLLRKRELKNLNEFKAYVLELIKDEFEANVKDENSQILIEFKDKKLWLN